MPNPRNPTTYGRLDPANWREIPDHYYDCIWPAKLPSSPSDYGNKEFHGRTHPEIYIVAFERYTKPGDLIWDACAGGGTGIDVAKEMDVHLLATDIAPSHPDVIKRDACVWNPGQPVDMVVLHPPYMDIIKYSSDENSLDIPNLDDWLDGMEKIINNATRVLKMNRVLVLIIGTVYKTGEIYKDKHVLPLDCELYHVFIQNYRLLGRVMRPYGETKGGTVNAGGREKNLWKSRLLKWGSWTLGMDTVYFWQKIHELDE